MVSCSVFNAENDGKVRLTLCLKVVEVLAYAIIEQIEQLLAMPSSTTTQHRVKRTSPTFSASKTERETITETSVLQSSKNGKNRTNQKRGKVYGFLRFPGFSEFCNFVEQTILWLFPAQFLTLKTAAKSVLLGAESLLKKAVQALEVWSQWESIITS